VRWLALGGIAGPSLFVAVVILCGALRPGYSHSAQFISELGALGTPNAALMNLGGFVAGGTLIVAFGISLNHLLRPHWSSVSAALLISMFGFGLVLAGAFPCAPGCPQKDPTLHDGVSIAAFLSAIAGLALAARSFRAVARWRPLWAYSAISSAAAFFLLLALATSIDSRVFTGIWQRLLLGTLFLWCAVVGSTAFRWAKPAARGPTSD
jgi:hypothetical membrane protein